VKDLSKAGLDLAFVAYPAFVSTFQFQKMWAVIFFLLMLLIGVDSIFGVIEFLISYLWDCFPGAHKKVSR